MYLILWIGVAQTLYRQISIYGPPYLTVCEMVLGIQILAYFYDQWIEVTQSVV